MLSLRASMSTKLYQPRFVLVLVLQFLFGLGFSSFLLLPKYLAEEHHADATLIGRSMAAGPIAAVLAMPFLAARIDQLRRHYLLSAAGLTMLVASLGFTELGSLEPMVYVLRALQGAAFTVYMSTGATLVADLAPSERLGQALGLLGAANLATNAIGPGLAEPIAVGFGWQPVFFASAMCSFLAATGAWALVEPRRVRHVEPTHQPVFDRPLLGLLYVGMVVGVAFGTVVTFYQPLALELGIVRLRDLFIGYTLTALGVRVLLGAWLDRFRRQRLALAAASLYGLVVLATAGLRPGWLLPLGLGMGIAHGTLYPILSALVAEGSSIRQRGARMTYFAGSFNVGMVLSTLGGGALVSALGYRPVFVLAAALVGSAVAVVFAATT
jgi:MFS family permease